jgi:uncharacterized protein
MRTPGKVLIGAVVAFFVVMIFGRSVAVFYTDALWFGAVGQSSVFWTRLTALVSVRLVTGAIGAALIMLNLWFVLRQLGPVHLRRRYGNLEIAEQVPRSYLVGGALAVAVLAGWWLSSLQFGGNVPVAMLAWLRHEAWGTADPLFGRDLSFYVFSLPVYTRLLDFLLIVLIWSTLLVGIGYVLVGAVRATGNRLQIDERPRFHFAFLAAAVLLIFAARFYLGRYLLLMDGGGFSGTVGYTDVHARLPARLVLALLAVATAVALVYGAVRRTVVPPIVALVVFALVALGMGTAYPAIMQRLQVEPNQLGREVEYIRWHMQYTQAAFGLDAIQRRGFTYSRPDPSIWEEISPTLEQLPLWDPEPLQTAFTEMQSRYRYYQFPDVDFDRYGAAGSRQQVAVAVREFTKEGLADNARTWQTIHMNPLFTRGMGAVVTAAAEKEAGEPVYWLSEVPRIQRNPFAPPAVDLREPSIYFGETMADYAIVDHIATFSQQVPDLPAGMSETPHVSTGVPLSSFARVAAFAWRFGDQNLLFTRELGDTSRLLFRRPIHERVGAVAPFLLWDQDAHPVLQDGRVVWVLDGYTVSGNYPLSRPFNIPEVGRLRYMRSSVKATVDAVTGELRLFALPEPDPILATYRAVFPGLVEDWAAMPQELAQHLRYPALLFRVQTNTLQEFHLERAEQFYAGQDVWQLPQEISPAQRRRFRPGFMMAAMPGAQEPEFLLINSFIARERQNMTALLIARSDAPHYGELVLLELPRDDQIRGPSQVQALIEQDPEIARQLSLWRQAGSTVDLGRLRIIPTENTILYVEPVYLAAQERAIPQLQRVIVSDGTTVAMEPDLETAIAALTGQARPTEPRDRPVAGEPTDPLQPPTAPADDITRRALELMREADARLRAGDFAGFGAAWSQLRAVLEQRPGGPPQQ